MDEIKKNDNKQRTLDDEMLIDYAKKILELPTCNTCSNQKTCAYAPGWGEWVRINCMFYEGR